MRSLPAIGSFFVVTCVALAQTDRGTITGTVSDPAGAVIAGASIQAKNVATGATYPAASSGTGNYTVAQLPAGTYDLTISAPGFKQYVRTGLVVEVAGILRIDAAMQVGTATETVEVTGAAPILDTESTQVAYNVTTNTLNDLPVLTLTGSMNAYQGSSNFFEQNGGLGNIRNPLSSLVLLPGTNFATDNVLRVNGMPSSSESINIEGQNANNGLMGQLTQMTQGSTDAIQEVAIQTSNYAAEFGQAGGGYFNYTMKSGTNQLHASAYDYYDNEALNAGLPFTDAGAIDPAKTGQHVRNALRQNDYGFTVGGPVVIPKLFNGHDKMFFFFNFEQFRQSNFTTNTIVDTPTDAFRQGDFSGALVPFIPCNTDSVGQTVCLDEIFDPKTDHLVNGVLERDPFPGNRIPLSRIDPTAAIMQSLFPEPNLPSFSGLNNYVAPGYSDFRHTSIPSLKIDYNINSKMKLAVYYSATYTNSPQYNGFNQPWTARVPQDILSQTVRINFDDTITPTTLLHLGAGLLHTSFPDQNPPFNQLTGINGGPLFPQGAPFPGPYFPELFGGLDSPFGGGFGPASGNFNESPKQVDIKPTFNASATLVRGNHTVKIGASALFEGIPTISFSRGPAGLYTFAQTETADPQQLGQPWAQFLSSGYGYASFFLGAVDSLGTGAESDSRVGYHSFGLYLQDSWKVTRKLTLDLGLRWDYANLWQEEHGRIGSANFYEPNPTIGGRPGAVEYEATCHCQFTNTYPFSIGPHLGVAYQITPKTVFRAGGAIAYGAPSDNAGFNLIYQDVINLNPAGYGLPATQLRYGDPYGVGNVLGNPVLTWPNSFFQQQLEPAPSVGGAVPPSSPFVSITNTTGRLPRIWQWSIGMQREISGNLVVEASYVGNRGVWWVAPVMAGYPNYNTLTPQGLLSQWGLNVANPADHDLLNDPVQSAAVQARFPGKFPLTTLPDGTVVANSVYPGFPASEPLNQAIRPWPQWQGVPPFLGPPLGDTWYDALQAKVTQRLSHGLSVLAAYTFQKEQDIGLNAQTSYVTPGNTLINDVFNRRQNKQLSSFDLPHVLTISFSYTTPKLPAANGTAFKALSWLVRDWTYSGVLRYQSGFLIASPGSNNQLFNDLGRGFFGPGANNPAIWGGADTFYNRVPGQPLFLVNPNSHFDPTTQLVLNPNAWVDAPLGQFGTSAAYYNNFRWQRQPAESMSFGRLFRVGKEGKYQLQIRAEFYNIFNRLFYSAPTPGAFNNPATATAYGNSYDGINNLLSAGFGYVNWFNGAGAQPRSGQLIARFQF
jgi:hypothetical protein